MPILQVMESAYAKRKARGQKTIGMVVTEEQHRHLRAAAALADEHLGDYVYRLVITDLERQGVHIARDRDPKEDHA
jgi:hypothetical protein